MTRLLFLLPVALLGLSPAAAQDVPSAPAYACAPTTLVALPDQAAALGLTTAQTDSLRALQRIHLSEVHDTLGEIRALTAAFHELARPLDLDETFALFYDLGGHYAELDDTFRSAESSLFEVLTDEQRARWTALLAEAASYQETPSAAASPACGDGASR